MEKNFLNIARAFRISGVFHSAIAYGSGHINQTYLLQTMADGQVSDRYILQTINSAIFKDPHLLMENIERVTAHLRQKMMQLHETNIDRKVLTIISTMKNTNFHQDEHGNYWRMYRFIENTQSYDQISCKKKLYQVAYAFGNFIKLLSDFPFSNMYVSLPNFHNSNNRFSEFEQAMRQDVCQRAEQVKGEIDFILTCKPLLEGFQSKIDSGKMPRRVVHYDTKINNVLLDCNTGTGMAVIDLDTVMPGYAVFDFADLIRSGVSGAREDEQNLSKIAVDLDRFEIIVQGFFSAAQEILDTQEIMHMLPACLQISLMIAIRFLTDYLNGDHYFKTAYPDHNRHRCQVHLALAKSIMANSQKMQAIILKTTGN
jgi:thiamine kinase-like enzyme